MTSSGHLALPPSQSEQSAQIDLTSGQHAPLTQREEIEQAESHNLLWLALQQIILRVGWVFKTESVIMPAFLDAIAGASGASTLRSLLPMLNRFGQSLPPLWLARRLKAMPRKKRSLAVTSSLMGILFLAMSGLWFLAAADRPWWLPAMFLVLYALFFCCTGMNNLGNSTLQGKLIRPTRRGRLMAVAASLGAVFSVTACWFLMRPWLALPDGGFGWLFLFAGSLFLLAAGCVLMVREPPDARGDLKSENGQWLSDAWRVVRRDGNFRRLAAVAMLFSVALLLFPHYQALGRERLGLSGTHLMVWVIVQNVSIGLFSLVIGPLADARGTRLTLRTVIFITAITPLLAIALTFQTVDPLTGQTALLIDKEIGRSLYWLVFAPLGLAPVTLRTMNNYTLELCEPEDHPRYLSTLALCLSLPFCLSPLLGWLIDRISFEVVFIGGFAALLLCGLLTFRLIEPRHHSPQIATSGVALDD